MPDAADIPPDADRASRDPSGDGKAPFWRRLSASARAWGARSTAAATDLLQPRADPEDAADIRDLARERAPVVWLLGKVAAGKSSIVQALTGDTRAAVGEGFRACTRTATVYDFPADAPALRFLDTRGLGEVGYDPAEDLAVNPAAPHLLMPVFRVSDPVQKPVLDALRDIRRRHPDWPVLAVLTALHETYPAGYGHPTDYPFGEDATRRPDAPAAAVPEALARAIDHRREALAGLPGKGAVRLVAVDLTRPEDGLSPPDFGLEALRAALADTAPPLIAEALRPAGPDAARLRAEIVGHASAAAASDLIPVAGAVAVPVVWGRLLQALADRYGVRWDRSTLTAFLGALGGAVLAKEAGKHGLKQIAKLVPGIGWTAGAAGSAVLTFATGYALGEAACRYLADVKAGRPVDTAAVRAAFEAALRDGVGLGRAAAAADADRAPDPSSSSRKPEDRP